MRTKAPIIEGALLLSAELKCKPRLPEDSFELLTSLSFAKRSLIANILNIPSYLHRCILPFIAIKQQVLLVPDRIPFVL
jgi:hypothetical protein